MEHFVFLEATRDLSTALTLEYNFLYVFFSISIAIFASYTAFLAAERIAFYAGRRQRLLWIAAGGITLGAGVWAMHFIGMLAVKLPLSVNYDIGYTLLSLIPVFFASLILLFNGLESKSFQKQLIFRSLAMGAGIGVMHYIGMMGMRIDAVMRYDLYMVLFSVVAAVVLAYVALRVKLWAETGEHDQLFMQPKLIAALIMGSAISAMHYIGMSAIYFFPSDIHESTINSLDSDVLAEVVGGVVLSLIGLLFLMVFLSRQFELLTKLKISEDRMSAILDNAGDAIITINHLGLIQNYNQAAINIFGYSHTEVMGRNLNMLMSLEHMSNHDAYLADYASTGIKKVIGKVRTLEARHKDGHLLAIEITVTELKVNNQVMFTGLIRDVTEKVNSERELTRYREHLEVLVGERTRELQDARDEALEATKTKSEFLANMSHELRTPLNSIIGFSGIVKDGIAGPVNDEQKKQLTMVYNSARHLLDLINDILDLSKIEAGKMEIYKEDINFHELVNDVCHLMQPQVSASDLTLKVEFDDVAQLYYTDAKMLRQVLLNLLSNAIKFTRQGEVTVKCSVFKSLLQIVVSDTGIGINKEGLEQIFGSFKQLDAGDDRLNEGSGLGLAICRQFIELLGGTLIAKSEVGIGSVFTIQLPIEERELKVDSRLGLDASENASFEAGEKLILIVDDEGDARVLLNTYLKNDGFQTIMCSNGEDAIALAIEYKPFAITLDVLMPDMDGWAVLASLKSNNEISHIPVIIISTLDEHHLGLSLGAVDYIQKPISSDDLMKSLMALTLDGTNVLVVENHEQDALLLKKFLEPAGYHVRIVDSGVKAFEEVEHSLPDAILLDLMMPEMSGFEFIRRLRAHGGIQADIPIIVVSAKTLTDAERKYLNEHVTKILVKGQFDRENMVRQVSAAINTIKDKKPLSGKHNE